MRSCAIVALGHWTASFTILATRLVARSSGSQSYRGSEDLRKIRVEFIIRMRAQLHSRAIDPNRTLMHL